jgi:toxin ParE1/3/4
VKLTWTGPAAADLDDLVRHIAQDSVTAAFGVEDRIHRAISRLPSMPRSGRIGQVDSTFELVVPRTPYIVIYSLEADEIVIGRVIHGRQQWPPTQ